MAQKELRHFDIDGKAGAIAVSSDGQLLGVSYDKERQGIIQVYKLHTGELDGQRPSAPSRVNHLFVGSNGNLTAFNGSLYHWNGWSDQQQGLLAEAQAALDGGGAVATSSDQNLLALFDRGQSQISVHDLSMNRTNSWPVDQASVADIAFDPSSGDRLVSFDYNGTIRLWSASSQKAYLNLQAGSLANVEFSADGLFLAANGRDGTVKVWDTRDGRPVAFRSPRYPFPTASWLRRSPQMADSRRYEQHAAMLKMPWMTGYCPRRVPDELVPHQKDFGGHARPRARGRYLRLRASCVLCGSEMTEPQP